MNLKHAFSGERAIIVGNGKSLTMEQLEDIRNEFSFGMNKIALVFDDTDWRPDFFINLTSAWSDDEYRPFLQAGMDESFLSFTSRGHGIRGPKSVRLRLWHPYEYNREYSNDWWSDDISDKVSMFGTSALAAMQIAVYLGFNPLILIGMNGYYSGKDDHVHQDYKKTEIPYEHLEVINWGHEMAHHVARHNTERLGVQVWNASPGSSINSWSRKDLHQIL